jgi:transposase
MNTSTPRRHLSPEEKVALLRRHLLEKVPISDLCAEHGIQPSQFYLWQKAFFENGAAAFDGKGNGRGTRKVEEAKERRIAFLEAKLQRKDEVIAELMEDHVRLKKSLGES